MNFAKLNFNKMLLIIIVILFGGEAFFRVSAQVSSLQSERAMRQNAAEHEARGNCDQAIELYRKILAIRPQDLSLYLSAKRCFLQNRDFQSWQNLIKEIQKFYRDILFEVDLAEIAYINGQKSEAIQKWLRVIEENPTSERAYVLVGGALVENHLYAEAMEVYSKGRKNFKDPLKFCFEVIRIYQTTSDFEPMTEEYLKYLEKNTGQIHFIQGQLLNAANSSEATEKIAKVILNWQKEKRLSISTANRLLGALYTQQKDYKKALKHYLALEAELQGGDDEGGSFLYSFATAAMNDGALNEARQAFELVAAKETNNLLYRIKAEYNLAQIFEQEGNFLQAIKAYEKFVDKHKKSDEQLLALFRMADIYFQRLFDVGQAETIYLRILKMASATTQDKFKARQKLSECALARGDVVKAQQYLDGIMAETTIESSHYRQAALNASYLDIMRGKARLALERLEKLLGESSSSKQLSAIDVYENDLLDLYIFLKDNERDSLGVALFGKVHMLQWQRRHPEAVDSIRKFLDDHPSTKMKNRLRFLEIASLRHLGKYGEAISIAQEILSQAPPDEKEKISKLVVDIYADDLHLWDRALKEGEAFLQQYPNSIYIDEIRKKVRALAQKNRI